LTSKIRIVDIARLAGVSPGTVDRVLHDRSGVSDESRKRVLQIIEEMHYEPNLLARSLASKSNHHIVCILPNFQIDNAYWEAPLKGVQRAAREVYDFNVAITVLSFEHLDLQSFNSVLKKTLQLKPDAVLCAPVFREETISFAQQLEEASIPYLFIDSNIEKLGNITYIGQNSWQSGQVAARLLQTGLSEGDSILVVRPVGAGVSAQTIEREHGFRSYFEDRGWLDRYQIQLLTYQLDTKFDEKQHVRLLFDKPVQAAVMFNSRIHELASFIARNNLTNIRLVGYDLTQGNVECLRKGSVSFLLAQRPETQGYLGVMTLFNALVLKKEVSKTHYMPIDILTRENIDYYQDI
jgi:LacI family transcriptional regulator